MALEYGINFNTEAGRKKAEEEIKAWRKDMQSYFDKHKLEIGIGGKEGSTKTATRQLQGYRKELQELRNEYRKLSTTELASGGGASIIDRYRKLREQVGIYGGTLDQVVKAEDRMRAAQEKTTSSVDRQTKAYKRQSDAMNQLKSYAMNFLSVYAGIRMVKNLATITGEFEMQKVSMQAILQDAEKGAAIFERIKELAVISPFQFKDLVSYTKQLSAFSVPYEELYDTTKMLADLSAGLGVGMDRLILAYGQVRSAAVLRGQELRQFTEAGIPIVEELRKKLSEANGELVTTGEVFEYISARKVPFEMVRDILVEMTSEGGKFYKMQEVQAETLKGKIANLTDAFQIMLSNIGNSDGGLMKGTIDATRSLIENYETVGRVLISLVAVYGIYRAAVIANTIAENGFRASQLKGIKIVRALTAAQAALNKVMLMNPYVLVAAGIALLGVGLWNLAKATDASKRAQEAFNKQVVKSTEAVEEERREIQRLIDLIKDETQTRATKQRALSTLQSMYPAIFNNMDIEAVKVKDLADLMSLYNKELDKNTKLRAKQSIAEAERILRDGDFSGSARGRANRKAALSIMGMEANEWNLATWNARNLEERFRKYTDLLKSADRERLINEFNSKTDAERVVYIDQRIEALKREKDALESQSESQWGELPSPEGWKRTPESIQKEIDSLNNKRKELLSTNQAEVITADKLIAQYNRLTESIRAQQELLKKGATDEDSVRELQEQQAKVADRLKLMGIDMSPDKDTSDKAKKEAEKRTKEYLDAIQSQVDEYKKKFDIWNTIYERSGKKPAMDFDITFNGEPDVSKYIKSKMQEIGGGKLNLDVDFLTADFSDILNGAGFDEQTKKVLQDMFSELRSMYFDERKELQDLYDKYATYIIKKQKLDRDYSDEREKLIKANASKEILDEQFLQYKNAGDALATEFAERDMAFNEFVNQIADKSIEELGNLLLKIDLEMSKMIDSGGDSETIAVLRAKIVELERLLRSQIGKNGGDVKESFKDWKKLQTILGKVDREIQGIGDSIGGTTGELVKFAGGLTATTLKMVNSIVELGEQGILGIKLSAEGAAKSIKMLEQASVILAVLSAALQVYNIIKGLFDNKEQVEYANKLEEDRNRIAREYNRILLERIAIEDTLFGGNDMQNLVNIINGYSAAIEKLKELQAQEMEVRDFYAPGRYIEYMASARDSLRIKTKTRNWFQKNVLGMTDEFENLEKWVRKNLGAELFGEDGMLNLDVAKEVVKLDQLDKKTKEYIETLISVQEAAEEFEETISEMIDDVFGELGDSLTNALVEGFRNGSLAAEDFKDDITAVLEDVAAQMVRMLFLQQYIDKYKASLKDIYEDYAVSGDKEAFMKNMMDATADFYGSASKAWDDASNFMTMFQEEGKKHGFDLFSPDNESNLTGISKGVSTITEDTALVLGGYLNSIRMRLFEYIDFMMLPENRPVMSLLIQSQATMINHLQAIELNTKITADKTTRLSDNFERAMVSTPDGWKLNVNA